MVDESWSAVLVGVASFLGILGLLSGGILSDMFGRIRIMLIVIFLTAISTLLISFTSYGLFFIAGLFLLPIASAAYFPVLHALIADQTSSQQRSTVVGAVISAGNLLAFFAPGLIGHLADNYGFRISFIYPIMLAFVGCLATFYMKREDGHPKK